MKYKKTLILSQQDIKKLVSYRSAIRAVESAFAEYGRKRVQMPPKMYLTLTKYSGDFRAMPTYLEDSDICAIKWVNVHTRNKAKGLPVVMAVVILSDPKTGFPLCIMDGTYATSLRTAAAGAVAAKYLANSSSRVVALVGCGVQARTQLEALRTILKIKEVKVWGKEQGLARKFCRDMRGPYEHIGVFRTVKDCVQDADVIITTTPSSKPLVKYGWIKPGVHINAIGADAPGKQELDAAILKHAKVIIDDWEQASHSGEINVAITKGLLRKKDIYGELGHIVIGRKKGRTQGRDITVFDSTGLAIQDAAVASLIYRNALKNGKGRFLSII